ncbi:MAG: anion permease [Lachnospiraceae bacterium]|nr:anion permease [Lachnospiraceae bacterium]
MTLAQILAIIIFVVMFILIIMDKIPRHYVTLTCAVLTIVLVFGLAMRDPAAIWEALNFKAFTSPSFWHASGGPSESAGINWETIVFIAGMMIMVEGMSHSGFFRWLCMKLARMVHYKKLALFISFMVLSSVLAMFIDSITVILFLVAVTIELASLLEFDPIPMIMTEIFCANLGGSATMCGDPPNIIIGTSLGMSFFDFLSHTGVCAGISLIFIVLYFTFVFRNEFKKPDTVDVSKLPTPESAIVNKTDFIKSTVIFALAVVLLVSHSATGLTVSFIGVLIAILTMVANPRSIKKIIRGVDYVTLTFFMGLFVVVSGLEQTGVLNVIADFISSVCDGNQGMIVSVILWISGAASAFVDNIPFAATMVPVVKELATLNNMPVHVLAYTLAIGCDVGGSATPIGASANVVGISTAEGSGHHISWGRYCRDVVPATVIVLVISNLYLFMRYL